MLRKFEITYITVAGKEKTEEIEATSKYDAKQRFYRMHPKYEIIKIEEIKTNNGWSIKIYTGRKTGDIGGLQ